MALYNKLYLTQRRSFIDAATMRGAWESTLGEFSANHSLAYVLDPRKSGGGVLATRINREFVATDPYSILLYKAVSLPLASDQTISGTVDLLTAAWENDLSANIHWKLHLYVMVGDTDVVRGTLVNQYSEAAGVNEFQLTPARATGLAGPVTLTDVGGLTGDRIVVEIGTVFRNTITTQARGGMYIGTYASGALLADQTIGTTLGAQHLVFSNAIDFTLPTAPANDACASATTVASLPYSNTADLTAATEVDATDPVPIQQSASPYRFSAWYKYTPETTEFLSVKGFVPNFVPTLYPRVAVFKGTCGAFTHVAEESGTQFVAQGGVTYYFLLAHFHLSYPSTIEITKAAVPVKRTNFDTIFAPNFAAGNTGLAFQQTAPPTAQKGYFERTPYGPDPIDTGHPYVISTEAIQVVVGGGPGGVNAIDYWQPPPPGSYGIDDYTVCGIAMGQFGPLNVFTPPYAEVPGKVWAADEAAIQADYKFSEGSLTAAYYHVPFTITNSFHSNSWPIQCGLYFIGGSANHFMFDLDTRLWGTETDYAFSRIFTRAELLALDWVNLRIEWKCGTPTLSSNSRATVSQNNFNSQITITVDAPGLQGDNYTVTVVIASGANAPMTASLVGTAITITLGTGATPGVVDNAKNTALLIAAAVNALSDVSAIHSGTGAASISLAYGPEKFPFRRNFTNVAPDGYVHMWLGNECIASLENISLYFEYLWAGKNYGNSIWLGYYGLPGRAANLKLQTVRPPVPGYALIINDEVVEFLVETLGVVASTNARDTFEVQMLNETIASVLPNDIEITLELDGIRVFGGILNMPKYRGFGGVGGPAINTLLQAIDFNAYADRRVVTTNLPLGSTTDISVPITSSSASNPTTITTSTPHGLTTGANITIADHVLLTWPGSRAYAFLGQMTLASGNFADGDTVTIDSTVYTFETVFTDTPFKVLIGATNYLSIEGLERAINAGPGAGVQYGTGTTAHPTVEAVISHGDADEPRMSALYPTVGEAGNGTPVATTASTANWHHEGGVGTAELKGGSDAFGGAGGPSPLNGGYVATVTGVNTLTVPFDNVAAGYGGTLRQSFVLKDVLESIVDTYLAPYGITLDPAQADGPIVAGITAGYDTVTQILNNLSTLTGWIWEVDYFKVFRMWDPVDTPAAFDIEDDDGNIIGDLTVEFTETYANNIIFLAGGDGVGETVTDTIVVTGAEPLIGTIRQYQFRYLAVDNINSVWPNVLIQSGVEMGPVKWGMPDATFSWGWDWRTNSLYHDESASAAPGVGTTLTSAYQTRYPIIVTAPDTAQIALRGPYDKVIRDETIKSRDLAQARANEERDAAVEQARTVRYTSERPGLRPGTVQHINSVIRDIDADFLIIEVNTVNDESNAIRYRVIAVEGTKFRGSWRDIFKNWNR